MTPSQATDHNSLRLEARQLYECSLIAVDRAADWREALLESRKLIIDAVRQSDYLCDVAAALQKSGGYMLVYRHLLAPPTSQDQFKLICGSWPKTSEKKCTPIAPAVASIVAGKIDEWRARDVAPWVLFGRKPKTREIRELLLSIAPLMANQRVATARRNRLAREQEEALMSRLISIGWTKVASGLIDTQAPLQTKEFMHKARFASGLKGRAEVDIALGLKHSLVLAMECKVTNDETNSVKRINDVLKKASAWKDHWGNFVRPAALLQGVVKATDIDRLLEKNVQVFWSH